MIHTTVYVSTLVSPTASEDVAMMLDASRAANARRGISGLLLLRGRRVMQVLEGEEQEVESLFSRIQIDERHKDVMKVWSSNHAARRFPQWSMGFDDLDAVSLLPSSGSGWPEPTAELVGADAAKDGYVARRAAVLRRALVSGDRLVAGLAIILHGHRPETVLDETSLPRVRCAECRVPPTSSATEYPCSTAQNAIWALEGVLL
ncbi:MULTISPECIES: BLUF domain-containing protein [Actinomycetes]|uniref:BLUF domain-containing protein n=1 Tax=Actinomycetes TaxID=1760 RepID=UPI00142E0D44|nr:MULTISPECIES: BLUF domain-containing protein [Actinomycetes]